MNASTNGSKTVPYTAAQGRKFGLTVGLAFAVLATISWWRGHHIPVYALGGLAAVLILGALVIPGQLGFVERAWMGLATLISKVTTPVFMGVVYFGVLMPIGLLMRVFGRNSIKHKPVGNSYWAARSEARGSMLNQF
jgi:hypothetical protein